MIRLDPPALLALIPSMLGFAPVESVVAVGLGDNGEVIAGLRVDRGALLGDSASVAAQTIARHLERAGAAAAILVVFTDDDVRVACPALDAVHAEVAPRVGRADVWAVTDGRYFVPGCARDDCCGARGTRLPPAPGVRTRRDASDAVGQRWWAARDTRGLDAWRDASARRWDRALAGGGASPVVAARLAASLRDLRVRDYAVLALVGAPRGARRDALQGRSTPALVRALDALLTGAADRRDPRDEAACARLADSAVVAAGPRERAAALTLAAAVAWRDDDAPGALTLCEVALSHDPTYRLAMLMEAAAGRNV